MRCVRAWSGIVVALLILFLSAWAGAQTSVVHMTNSIHGAGWYQYLTEMAERFNALHPDIEVEIIRTSYYEDRYATMLAGGTPPDVTDFTPALAAQFVEAGTFLDLKSLMDADSDFDPGDLLPMSFEVFTLPDGSIWGFPVDIYPLVTYYNEDILSAAGLAFPNDLHPDDWNWDQVVTIARRTTIRLGDDTVVQYGIDRPNQRWITVLNQAGGAPYDRMIFPTESRWNTPEVREAMDWLRSLFVEHRVAAPYGSAEVSDFYFWLGKTAMHLAYGPGMIGGGYEDLGFGWDVSLPPKGPANRGSMYTTNAFQITADSPNAEAAWEWIKFIAYNEDSLARFIELTNRIPALASMQAVYPTLAENPPKHWLRFYETAMDPDIVPPPMDPNGPRVDEVVFAGFREIFGGSRPTEVVLEEVHRRVNAILQEGTPSRFATLIDRSPAAEDLGSGVIVFQSNRTASWQIFKYDLETGVVEQLTFLGQNYYPRISRDGTKVAFESTRDGARAVYTMNIDGSDQQRITPLDMDIRNASWSPDGEYITFHARVPEGGWAVHTIKADGTELRRLTYSDGATDAWASWSPDGKTIVFSSNRAPHGPNYQTYIINVDGTGERQLISNPRRSQRPVWSPDGKAIVVGSNRDGQWDIYIDYVDGSGSVRVTNDARTDLEPAWSPDGTKIVYTGDNNDGDIGIYVVNADGTGQRRLDVGPGQNQHPSWGPKVE